MQIGKLDERAKPETCRGWIIVKKRRRDSKNKILIDLPRRVLRLRSSILIKIAWYNQILIKNIDYNLIKYRRIFLLALFTNPWNCIASLKIKTHSIVRKLSKVRGGATKFRKKKYSINFNSQREREREKGFIIAGNKE